MGAKRGKAGPQTGPWEERARARGWPEAEIAEIAQRLKTRFVVRDVVVDNTDISWTVDEVFDFGHRLVTSPRRYVQKRAIRVESYVAVDRAETAPCCRLHGWACGPTDDGCGFGGDPVVTRELCACPPLGRHNYGCELRAADRAICSCGPFKQHRPSCARNGLRTGKVLLFPVAAGAAVAAPTKTEKHSAKNPNPNQLSLLQAAKKT